MLRYREKVDVWVCQVPVTFKGGGAGNEKNGEDGEDLGREVRGVWKPLTIRLYHIERPHRK
jgi:hypothetical protein